MSQTINVDITPNNFQPTLNYSQGDVGRTFSIKIVSQYGDTLPAGATVKIQATKPSGFGFDVTADSVTDNVATFTTTAEMTDEWGRFPAQLDVTKDAVTIFSAKFLMVGAKNTHPEGTTDGSQGTIIPELTLLVERVEAAASSVLDMEVEAQTLPAGSLATYSYDEALNKATFGIPQGEAGAGAAGVTASAYSASRTYAVGEYVIHNNNLYRCTTAITTAEAFTAAHWTQVVLSDDVSDLKSDINAINYDLSDLSDVAKVIDADITGTPVTGYFLLYTNGTAVANEYSAYAKASVVSGKKYYITCDILGNRGVCLYNGETFVKGLSNADTGGAGLTDYEIIIPDGVNVLGISTANPDHLSIKTKKYIDIKGIKSDLENATGTEEIQFQMGYSIVLDGSPIDLTPVSTWGCKCANIACSEDDIFTISGIGISTQKWLYAFLDSSNNVLSYLVSASVQQTNLVVVAPENSAKLIINNYIGTGTGDRSYKGLSDLSNHIYDLEENCKNIGYLKTAVGYEAYGFMDGKAITTPAVGTVNLTPVDVGSVSCCIIDCAKGDVFTINGTPRANSGTRPYMFVDSDNNVAYRSELETALVDYAVVAPTNGKLVVNLLLNQAHSVQKGYNNISKKLADYYAFKNEPLTNLPNYFVNNLSYKPIGELSKGYLCLSCDDGAVELGTYTIPMIEAKNVPCTFSLWSTSAVLTNYSADVVDAINNYGCELSQHGNQIWAEEDGAIAFTEERLRSFFDAEQEVWDSLGIVPKSAVCPAHYNNALVRAVAGGRFGVVRSGLDYVSNHYPYYTSGARSNLFGMSSQNVNGGSLDYWKGVIDYAYDNNKIVNLYWHDWDLSTEQQAKLEAVIDYAKAKGITFCTLGDIAHIL